MISIKIEMTSGSIVLYKTDIPMVSEVIHSFFRGEAKGRKLYLVDNSPTDELKVLKELYPEQTEYIFCNANYGYGKAHNIAIRKSIDEGFEFHVVLNPDLSFGEDVIPYLEEFMINNSTVGLCIPDIWDLDDEGRRPHARLLPSPMHSFLRRFATNWSYTKRLDDVYNLRFADFTKVLDIPRISGCFMFFRISCLREIGLFDERIFMYYEDVDISRRMFAKYRCCFVPQVKAFHKGERATYKSFKMLWVTIKSALYYFHKYGFIFDSERKRINAETVKNVPLRESEEERDASKCFPLG